MECAVEATPHEETRIYSSILEGGNLMQKFEEGESQDTPADVEERNDRMYPIRSEGQYVAPSNPWPRDEQKEARDIAGLQKESRILIEDKEIDGISMVSHPLQLPQRHTSRVTMYIASRHGDRQSQLTRTSGQLNPIDFKRPIRVMANGPDGQATSDIRCRTNGVLPPSGTRLPATMAHGRRYQIGKDHNGLPRLEGP